MLSFQDVTASNINLINSYLKFQTARTCDYTAGVVYMWRKYYKAQFAVYDDALIVKNTTQAGDVTFTLPTSGGDITSAISAIDRYTRENGLPILFDLVTSEQICLLEQHFGRDNLESHTERDWADYLYNIEDLVSLAGKKYSGQRNHINKFTKTYPDYRFVPITGENIDIVRGFMDYLIPSLGELPELAVSENLMIYDVLDNFAVLGAVGGYIEVSGKVAAFAIGEILGDVLYVHIEKADRSYPGSYTMINREFAAANAHEGILYVNREEDLGDLGLRTAKLSYHPAMLLEKHLVWVKQS